MWQAHPKGGRFDAHQRADCPRIECRREQRPTSAIREAHEVRPMTEHLGDIPAVRFEVNDPGWGAVSVATPVGKDELVVLCEGELVCPGHFTSTAGAVDEDDGRAGTESEAVEHEPERIVSG